MGRLAFDDAGRLVGLGFSLGLTAGPADGAAEDRLPAPVIAFSLLGCNTPLSFAHFDGFLSSTSGSSVSGGGLAVSAGGGRLDPLSAGFLGSFRGETERNAFLCACWGGTFPPALSPGSAVSLAGSARLPAGSAGGNGSTRCSVDFLTSFRGDVDLRARRCTLLAGIFPPALDLGSVVSLGGSSADSAGSAGGVGLGGSSTGLRASLRGETDLMDLRRSCLVIIFPPASPVTMPLFHQFSMIRRCWGGGAGGSGSGSGSGSALGVGGTDGGSQLWILANASADGSSGSQGG